MNNVESLIKTLYGDGTLVSFCYYYDSCIIYDRHILYIDSASPVDTAFCNRFGDPIFHTMTKKKTPEATFADP